MQKIKCSNDLSKYKIKKKIESRSVSFNDSTKNDKKRLFLFKKNCIKNNEEKKFKINKINSNYNKILKEKLNEINKENKTSTNSFEFILSILNII